MKRFTEQQVLTLSKNKFVKKVSEKAITYEKEFKELFLEEYYKGKPIRDIFSDASFDVNVLGKDRIHSASNRWREQARTRVNGIEDTRSMCSGRKARNELTFEEENKFLKQENYYLKKELEILKKRVSRERGLIH